MRHAYDFDPTIISNLGCKIYQFFNYGLDALSPWCLVYISVEKFISIAYPSKRYILKKKQNQTLFFIILCLFNFFYRLNIPFSAGLMSINNLTICFFDTYENQLIISNMDLVNLILIPFILMILFSSLLIGSIFKARRRVGLNNSDRENRRRKQDIKVSFSLLSMNLLFILLNLPLNVALLLPAKYFNIELYVFFSYVFNISSGINFYLNLLTNSIFRSEFISLFIKRKQNQAIEMSLQTRQIEGLKNRQAIDTTHF